MQDPEWTIPTEAEYRREVAAVHPELADDLAKVPAGYVPILSRVVHFDGVDEAAGVIKKRAGAFYISSIEPYPTRG